MLTRGKRKKTTKAKAKTAKAVSKKHRSASEAKRLLHQRAVSSNQEESDYQKGEM